MKRPTVREGEASKGLLEKKLSAPFTRTLDMLHGRAASPSNVQVSPNELPQAFLTHDELQRINAQLLKIECQKAEAIQRIRERNRCI